MWAASSPARLTNRSSVAKCLVFLTRMFSLNDNRHSVAGPERRGRPLWFCTFSALCGNGQHQKVPQVAHHLVASWLRPEWMVTSITHIGFCVLYPSACVLTLRWLHFVGCYLWLEPTGICRHGWLQVAVRYRWLEPSGTCRHSWLQLTGCLPWLKLICVPDAWWMLFSDSYCLPHCYKKLLCNLEHSRIC